MVNNAPVLLDHKKKVEEVIFKFDNPGEVKIKVPTITCERTKQKFFHPDDIDQVISELQQEYHRVYKKSKP